MSEVKTCCIISENSMGLECAKIWHSNECKVTVIISSDQATIDWSNQNNIECYFSVKDFSLSDNRENFDYLFSIANNVILKDEILDLPRVEAINFHDGPLPKYAGVHATSWAILNGEKTHGITWHVMSSGIDVGDIIIQNEFDILSDETSLSLNLKCYDYAIDSFGELKQQIIEGSIKRLKQNQVERSYFAQHKKPTNFGIINWNDTAEEIHKSYRGLFFGNYKNRLCSFKLCAEDEFFIPKKLDITNYKSDYKPGTVVSINNNEVQITTKSFDVILGVEQHIIEKYNLTNGYVFPLIDTKICSDLSETGEFLSKYEFYWVKQLKSVVHTNLHLCQKTEPDQVKLLSSSANFKTKAIPENEVIDYVLAAFLIYIARTTDQSFISINLNSDFIIENRVKSAFSKKLPFNFDISDNFGALELVKKVSRKIQEISDKKTFITDLVKRIPELSNLESLPVTVNILDSKGKKKSICDENQFVLNIYKNEKSIECNWQKVELNSDNQKQLDQFLASLLHIFDQIIAYPNLEIKDIEITTPDEKQFLLTHWNNTQIEYPTKTIKELFEEQVAKTPNDIALEYNDKTLTYKQLNNKSNQLAHYLKSLGISKGDIVAISLERSLELIIGMFAILKSGAAYVPLEPNYPDDRLQLILDDTKAVALFTQKQMVAKFDNYEGRIVIPGQDLGQYSEENPESNVTENDIAYITYTSGSTGIPKGVVCHHLGVTNRLHWAWSQYPFTKNEVCCLQSSIAFVDSTWDIFGTLLIGSRLVLFDEKISKDAALLLQECFNKKITRITFVPSMLKALIELVVCDTDMFDLIKHLNQIEVTGELFDYSDNVEKFVELFKGKVVFLDCYGATEATSVIYRDFSEKNDHKTHILANTQIYILDKYMMPVPCGVRGEIYIGGLGLAKGYLNKSDLTAEKFVQNPISNNLLYKTGDIVKRDSKNNIEFLGREDSQIKIRGHRVELKEIELALEQYQDISQSIATFHSTNNGYLTAYVVLRNSSLFEVDKVITSSSNKKFKTLKGDVIVSITENIKQYLVSKLPDYMIPAFFIYLDQVPLNNNGKRDIETLPAVDLSIRNNIDKYVAPRDEIEKKLSMIWGEILSIPSSKIGIFDNFFSLGGNSILSIRIASLIKKELSTQLTVAAIFQHNTIEKLANYLLYNSAELINFENIAEQNNEMQQLSFAQERLWFIEQYEDGSNAYNIPIFFKLSRNIKLDILKKSIEQILERQEILRTLIVEKDDGNGCQYVCSLEEKPLVFSYSVVSNKIELDEKLEEDANYIYDFSTEYPIKCAIYELSEEYTQSHYLSVVIHHIAFDGWSNDLFLHELNEHYAYNFAKSQGINISLNLPDVIMQYHHFTLWQRGHLSGDNLKQQVEYWGSRLAGFEPLNLITDFIRPKEVQYSGENIEFCLSNKISNDLRTLAKNMHVSLYSVLLSGYYLMLRIYSNQNDIILGTSVANRHHSQIENLIGFFVNILALRTQVNTKLTIEQFIKQVGNEVTDAQLHQDLPFEKLVDELNIEKDPSRHPIFQVMFEMHSFGKNNSNGFLESYAPEKEVYNIAKFDLSTLMDDSSSYIQGVFNYSTSLYKKETIEGYIETYTYILEQFANMSFDHKLSDLTYLPASEYQQIVYDWNNVVENYPSEVSIAELFEKQVENNPDNIAVIADGRKLTYAELNKQVNRLAHYFKQHYDTKPDSLVMIVMDRDIEFLVSMLAVFKVGMAYIPVDPSVPADRVLSIAIESNPHLALVSKKYLPLINNLKKENINICVFDTIEFENYNSTNLYLNISPYSLAYVIYTSGSTGRPKGAMIEYKGMINHLYTKISDMKISGDDKVAQTASQNFDISIWQFLSALLVGGTTVVFKGTSSWNPDLLLEVIEEEQVTIFQTVPSHMYAILPLIENDHEQSKRFKSLRWLIINGEPLSSEICDRWFDMHLDIPIINAYGYTESSDDITHFKIFSKIDAMPSKIMPISGTLPNSTVYITDSDMNPVPIGAVGEVIAGGFGIGRGYLNRPDLTQERYVHDIFTKDLVHNTLYHSGDLGRYLKNGDIEYIGRCDFQVKIKGYRIELEEIEAVLCLYEGIIQSVIIAHDSGAEANSSANKYLVGYYVSDIELDFKKITSYLSSKLPEYMVPEHLIHLTEFPLNTNGKLDRKALPKPELVVSDDYLSPRNALEEKVCKIWSELLGFENIGINDDFFKLGGDSIVSIQLVSRMRQKLSLPVSVKDIFTYRNIAKLYDHVLSKSLNDSSGIIVKSEQGRLVGDVDLLPIQNWFFKQEFEDIDHWNQSFMIQVLELEIDRLQLAADSLLEYHDAFRLRYKSLNNGVYEDANSSVQLSSLDVSSVSEDELQQILTNWQSGFDIQSGPVCSIGYLYGYSDGSSRIFFAAHHLVIDSISWRILVEDLQKLYNGQTLGDKGSSYRQWVKTVDNYASEYSEERKYWEEARVNYESSPSDSKLKKLVESESTHNLSTIEFDQDLTRKLLKESSVAYNSKINDLLLTALALALYELLDDKVNYITLEGHGREEIDESIDISRTVGWFTSMYPICLEISGNIGADIKQIKEYLRQIPYHGVGYGSCIGYDNYSLPRISFNYLGQFNNSEQKNWQIIGDAAGKTIGESNNYSNIININGAVKNDVLSFTIESKMTKNNTQSFANLFKDNVIKIVNHTVNQTRSYLTISDIDNIVTRGYLDKIQQDKEIESVYLANSLQQGFIYHSLKQGKVDDAYLVQVIWQYNNILDVDKLRQAWIQAIKTFPSLRLRFAWDNELIQIIDKQGKLDWRYIDLSDELDDFVRDSKIKQIQQLDRKEQYDLSKGGLFRIYLIKEKPDSYRCIFSNHHAIIDGWSNPVLLGYVHDSYESLRANKKIRIKGESAYEYTQQYLQKHLDDNRAYWQEYVSKLDKKSDLSGLLSPVAKRKNINLGQYNHIKEPCKKTIKISGDSYKRLKELSKKEGVTLNAICQYVWHKVLSIYTRNNKSVVGTIVSGRNLPIDNIENSVGLFINTLPLIVEHKGDQAVIDQIKTIQNNINEINSRSNVSLSSMQQEGQRLFDTLFVFENYPHPIGNIYKELKVKFKQGIEKLDYPLGVLAFDENKKLEITLQYAGELFQQEKILELLNLSEFLLKQIADAPQIKSEKLIYLNQKQYEQIIEERNDNKNDYPEEKTIDQLFGEQAQKTPDNIALKYKNRDLTYKQLNERVNQLANYLRIQYKIEPNDLVGLCVDRNPNMIIAMLAILKAGGAYVPIDPSYPDERIDFIVQDTKMKVLITNDYYKVRFKSFNSSILAIDSDKTGNLLNKQISDDPIQLTNSSNIAYVIYTSGTTGTPKGVIIEHKGVVSLKYYLTKKYELNNKESILFFANYVFDASVEQLVLALLNGHKLVILDTNLLSDTDKFTKYLIDSKVTHIHAPPIVLDNFDFSNIKTLKRLIFGGDRLTNEVYYRVKSSTPDGVVFINEYGPTETTVTATVSMIKNGDLSIGKPVGNIEAYILDKNLQPIPNGAIGELYLGGVGVAAGYLNRPALTNDKFIKNPFTKGRLYKTGDLVRYIVDGNIEYIGRQDFQVKVRGYRIELGEIESALSSYEEIRNSAVITYENNSETSKNLIAYYVSESELNQNELTSYLSKILPKYMVPQYFVHLAELPLNTNGKLDRNALPQIIPKINSDYLAPRNELEKHLCDIWSQMLSLPNVGINDDFFTLGGDSIISIRLISKLRSQVGVILSITDIFDYRTIGAIYDNVISKTTRGGEVKAEQGILGGKVSLSPIQQWFFVQNFTYLEHWNQSFLIQVPELDIDRLKKAVSQLIKYHDSFKLRYKKSNNKNIQYYDPTVNPIELELLDITKLGFLEDTKEFQIKLENIMTSWQANFNLEKGPICSVGYIFGYKDKTARIYFAAHHLVIDTVSWRIIIDDLKDLYEGKTLGDKGSSYRQWINTANEYSQNNLEEKIYWQSVLDRSKANALEVLISNDTYSYSECNFTENYTKTLLQRSNSTYKTEINDILLTSLAYTLFELTDNEVNFITLEGHGREELDQSIDISRTTGWFTSMYPVCLEVQNEISSTIKHIKETLRKVPNKGIGYGSLIGYKNNDLPKISFNYLGRFDHNTGAAWNIIGDHSGNEVHYGNHNYHTININGIIIDGKLQFSISSKFSKAKTSRIAKLLKKHLENIINHTSKQDRSYLTASDVNNIVSSEYLENLQERREISSIYLANSLQQGFIYHSLNQGNEDDAYCVQTIWNYKQNIDVAKLKQAWQCAQQKYACLRLNLAWQEQLIQIIYKNDQLDWHDIDLLDTKNCDKEIERIQQEDRLKKYDLENGCLFRIYLIKQSNNLFTCIFSNHHAILDGWSLPIMLDFVHSAYIAINSNNAPAFNVDNSYEYAQNHLQENQDENTKFWQKYVSQIEERVNINGLLSDQARADNVSIDQYKHVINPASQELIIEGELYTRITELLAKEGVTLNALMQYVWHKILSVYGNNNQTVVGTVVSGRNLPIAMIENSVGLYINTLPLIVNHSDSSQIVINQIKNIQNNINKLNSKSNVNLAKLHKDGERLFDTLFVFENYPTPTNSQNNKLLDIEFTKVVEKLDYPLSASAFNNKNQLVFSLKYAEELFTKDTIDNLLSLTENLLVQIAKNPWQETGELNYLTEGQYNHVIFKLNETESYFPKDKTIHRLFEEQVAKTPDNTAVTYQDYTITYSELNERVNQLANHIKNHEISNKFIALFLDRSVNTIISIFAVLKSGAAYVPIDSSTPDERIKYILEDTKTSLVLTDNKNRDKLEKICSKKIIAIDEPSVTKGLNSLSKENLGFKTHSSDLAYVIYTSGTTGHPKGVMVQHAGVVSLKYNLTEKYNLGKNENILLFANYVFDASVEQIVLALLNGHNLIIACKELLLDLDSIYDYLNSNKVTHIHVPPLFLERYDFSKFDNLKRIISGGDLLRREQYNRLKSVSSDVQIINEYGPTETTITSIVNFVQDNDLSIGRPIGNIAIYILDKNLKPVPDKAIGDIYIGGIGVAKGYLNKDALTSQAFIDNPFYSNGTKIYKTGDLGRYLQNGLIEYIGRSDFQVKIRGYRIELGEIESILSTCDDIEQSVVLACESETLEGNKYLVGYYVAKNQLDNDYIMSCLSSKLPEYMLPEHLIYMDKLPLNVNGKLDRSALPKPELVNVDNYVAPRNLIEEEVCEIWRELLGFEHIGINDDFFRLGGDSIVSIQLVSRMRQKLSVTVSVKDIFTYRNIARLYDCVLSKNIHSNNDIIIKSEQGALSGEVDLLPIQSWFFKQNFAKANHWNQSFMIKVSELDTVRLQLAADSLLEYHDALRLYYRRYNDSYIGHYKEKATPQKLNILDVSLLNKSELHSKLTKLQSSFNIESSSIFTIGYLHGYKDGSARIYIAAHHLVIDSVSWRILTEDLQNLYSGNKLGDKNSSYRQWVKSVSDYTLKHSDEKEYWNNILLGYGESNSRLKEMVPSESVHNSCSLEFSYSVTKKILQESNTIYNTEINDLLLTALSRSLGKLTNDKINYVILEGHGREEIDECIDISRTVGWFTTMYPLCLQSFGDIRTDIRNVKETLRAIPYHGIGYGAFTKYETKSLPRVSFNYLGQFDNEGDNQPNLWKIVAEDSGNTVSQINKDNNILNINGWVVNGVLSFTIDSKLHQVDVDYFGMLFKENLIEIVEHISSQSRSYLSVSDVNNIITNNYLDNIQKDKEVESVYLTNSLQQGLIYHAVNQGKIDDAYLVQIVWQYNNSLELAKLKQAWEYAIQKFSTLRLRFAWDEEIVQIIDKEGNLDWRYFDLSNEISANIIEEKINQIQKQDRKESYDLSSVSLFRIYLIKEKEDSYRCIFSNHHAIMDGWSSSIFLSYIHDTYENLRANKLPALEKNNSYDFVQEYLQNHQKDHQDYWQGYISKIEDKGDLNGLLSEIAKKDSVKLSHYNHVQDSKTKTLQIRNDLYQNLKSLGKEEGITLNAICQYAWHKILNIYGGAKHTIVGTVVSGRNVEVDNIENAVGLLINTLPLIVDHDNRDIIDSIRKIQSDINEINIRSNIELSSLQKEGKRLFETLFVFENYPEPKLDDYKELRIRFKEGLEKSDYPLGILAYEENNSLVITLQYASELFDKETILEILSLMERLLEQIISTQDVHYLSNEQYKQIIEEWNDNSADYPQDKTIDNLFTEQVLKTPNNIAVTYRDINLSYDELNCEVNRLAHYLRQECGLKDNDFVSIYIDRSHYTLISILAVLKAGCAYVPIDPNYPDARIDYILQDSRSKLIITNEKYQKKFSSGNNILLIDDEATVRKLHVQSSANPTSYTDSSNIAYLIYTSGTTGNPKATIINHISVVNYIYNINSHIGISEYDKVDYSTSLGFDLTVTTTICPLSLGGQIIVYDGDVKDLDLYTEHLIKNNINFIKLTPSYFELLIDNLYLMNLEKVIVGGEKFCHAILEPLDRKQYRSLKIYDEYGPTESTVGVCVSQIYPDSTVTIGKAYNNNKLYVLDNGLQPLPIGAVGELYIGGVCLAAGYLNNIKLTEEKFMFSPFNKNERIYKTGDLVRYLRNGQLEYIGRKDNQVKIQGYRIELGEIESILSHYKEIKRAIVIVSEQGHNKYLAAYYVSNISVHEDELIGYLKQKLPEYMVPNYFIHLTEFPLNINGKIDQDKLPTPEIKQCNYLSPRNELETEISAFYSKVVRIPTEMISINDDFFKLGGNSILAIKLVSKINNLYQSNLRVVDIFVNRTVQSLALRIAQTKNIYQAIVKLNYTYELPNLFMIHPGAAGCEVYASLADKLADNFSCYGVDSYNLYNKKKITNLSELAKYYLEHIDQIMIKTNQKDYHILGWSLGGQLALEIAYILEKRHNKKIKLYLLDVILDDDYLLSLRNNLDLNQLKSDYREYANINGYDESHIEKIVENIDVETALLKKQINYLNLNYTEIMLFKALLCDTTFKIENFKLIYEYSISLEHNNVDKVINSSNINVINLENSSHSTILKEEKIITQAITKRKTLYN